MPQRILIVDDDTEVGEALKKVLADTGYSVEVAPDGEAGVAHLKRQRFDLLLLDLNLPKLSGFDLLDLAAEQYPTLPVVILTGELEHCEPGAVVGADALLEKPPEVALLLQTVAGLLSEPAVERLHRLQASLAREQALSAFGRGHLHLPTLPTSTGAGLSPGALQGG